MRTQDLIGVQLDWAVAKCEGWVAKGACKADKRRVLIPHPDGGGQRYSPSTDWNLAGAIIEREGITVMVTDIERHDDGTITFANKWKAVTPQQVLDCDDGPYGPTPLIAAMRCFCCSKLGKEINIPEELL